MPVLAFLEAEGVDTHTPDGNTLSIDPGLFVALGFYKIQVPQSQIEKARLLLAEWDEAVPLPDHVDTGENPRLILCSPWVPGSNTCLPDSIQ